MYHIAHGRLSSFMGMFSMSEYFWIHSGCRNDLCLQFRSRPPQNNRMVRQRHKTAFGQIPATLFSTWPRFNIEATQNGKHLYQSHKLCEAGRNNDQGARFWRLVLYPQTWSINIMNQHSWSWFPFKTRYCSWKARSLTSKLDRLRLRGPMLHCSCTEQPRNQCTTRSLQPALRKPWMLAKCCFVNFAFRCLWPLFRACRQVEWWFEGVMGKRSMETTILRKPSCILVAISAKTA